LIKKRITPKRKAIDRAVDQNSLLLFLKTLAGACQERRTLSWRDGKTSTGAPVFKVLFLVWAAAIDFLIIAIKTFPVKRFWKNYI